MPLLLNVLENANGPEYGKLRLKAMECAGLIGTYEVHVYWSPMTLILIVLAIAVGRDIFRPDANSFIELLIRIQSAFNTK